LVSPNEFSTRKLSRYYAVALLLIGFLALASHQVQRSAAGNIESMAGIINVSGRQRMISQRIASLVAQYQLGDASARQALMSSIADFETAHQRLSRGDLADNSSPNDPHLIQHLYFDGPHPVDAEIRSFIADAKHAASLPANDPALPAIAARLYAESRAPLLNALDHVVQARQQESESKVQRLRILQTAILLIMFLALLLEARFIFRPMVRKIQEFSNEILRLASTDFLTGVANRRGFFAGCTTELKRARRYQRPLSLLMLDADRFKQINDTYGHPAGDATLIALCQTLARNLRPSDIMGRVGGEEFAILLPETQASGAAALAERLRREVELLRIPHGDRSIELTISIGVAEVPSDCLAIDTAIQIADRCLYSAKVSGRNCVVLEPSTEATG